MAAADVLITCFDPAAPDDFAHAVTFRRQHRSGAKWSSTVPGGDAKASWTVSCDELATLGFPAVKARILIWDPVRVKYLWRGVLQTPREVHMRGRLQSVSFAAIGCAEGSWRQFDDPLIFGVESILGQYVGPSFRQVVTNLGEIMQYGLTICPLINGTEDGIADGGVLTEDSPDYKGHTAPQLWEDICSLTRAFEDPFVWLVEPDLSGLPALRFFAQPSTVEYFERGTAKESTIEIDFGEIANRIFAAYKGYPTIKMPADGDPLDYSSTPDIQTHFMELSNDFVEYDMAAGFVQSLYLKFNQRLVTGGSVVLDHDLRYRPIGDTAYQMIPITEVRAGRVMEIDITKTPYLDGVRLPVWVTSCEYDEDACTVTLSPTAINESGKQARIIAMRSEGAKINWGWLFRQAHNPGPDLMKLHDAYWQGSWASGLFGGGIEPWVSRQANNGYTRAGDGTPTAADPNSVPPPFDTPPPDGATEPVVVNSTVPFVKTREGFFGFGTLGGKIHKQALPDHRINIPAVFGTPDEDGALTDGERIHTDVQEGWIDTFTISVLNAISTTVTVSVDIWNWDLEDVRVADAFTLALSGVPHARDQYDNSDDDHRPVLLYHGDQLRWKVSGAADPVILNCALSGDKDWIEHPVLVGPEWLPGNA